MSKVIIEPTEQEYVLKCKVIEKVKHVKDHDRQYERRLIYLIPERNDQAMAFFRAWLPDTRGEYFELVADIPNPIASPCRLSVHRGPDEVSENHYLFVMSKGVEEIIQERKLVGKTLIIKILPESSDEVVDQVRDSGGDFDLIHGQESF